MGLGRELRQRRPAGGGKAWVPLPRPLNSAVPAIKAGMGRPPSLHSSHSLPSPSSLPPPAPPPAVPPVGRHCVLPSLFCRPQIPLPHTSLLLHHVVSPGTSLLLLQAIVGRTGGRAGGGSGWRGCHGPAVKHQCLCLCLRGRGTREAAEADWTTRLPPSTLDTTLRALHSP